MFGGELLWPPLYHALLAGAKVQPGEGVELAMIEFTEARKKLTLDPEFRPKWHHQYLEDHVKPLHPMDNLHLGLKAKLMFMLKVLEKCSGLEGAAEGIAILPNLACESFSDP